MEYGGFIDLQLNGYRGVDFSSPDLSLEGILRITEDLAHLGTAGYCATLITSSIDIYRRNLSIIAEAMRDTSSGKRILGIHLEGPYISALDGARGAHPLEHVRAPDPDEFDRFQDWADGGIRILTLAPELEGAIGLIGHVRRRHGTLVSLGHHAADRLTIARAADAGAALCTHLGNGCPEQIHRHRNVIISQLDEEGLGASLITDGHHLPPELIRVILRCKGPDRIVVVSDLAPIAGFEPGIYKSLGNDVELTPDGRMQNLHTPYLVGSGCDIARCMRYLRSLDVLSTEDLWKVGRFNALRFLGMDTAWSDGSDLSPFQWEP